MIKRLILFILLVSSFLLSSAKEKKYFDEVRFSVYQGYRNIYASKHLDVKNLDFLNYLYTKDGHSDYPYFELGGKLRHENYQLDLRLALYNNLIPYCYSAAFSYFLNPRFGILAGSMGNRYYLTEFNDFYNTIWGNNITSRYIQRQWNLTQLGFFIGPSYQINYQSVQIDLKLKTGVSSFYPFRQENIIKEPQSNYKLVLNYQTRYHFLPFVMPEIELSMDLMKYKNAIIGGRIKYAFLYTKTAIKYDVTTYEWTYDFHVTEQILLSYHSFIQSDIDFGIFVKW